MPSPLTPAPDGSQRLLSLDALRGFDMFWIVGGGAVVRALEGASESGLLGLLRTQLTHVEWGGFRFYDLIFPLFVFISGVSALLSLRKARERGGVGMAARRLLRRALLIFVVGVFYSGGLNQGWDGIRWMGVLQRIALAYAGAGLIYLFLPFRALPAVWAAILLGYWAVMAWVPIRDIRLDREPMRELMSRTGQTNAAEMYRATTNTVTGRYEPGYNVAHHVDFRWLPGRRYDVYWDPEGILSTVPAVATCLLGILAGALLVGERLSPGGRVLALMMGGLLLVLAGLGWGVVFPVVKKIWTSSYVLVAGGFSAMLLGLFYLLVDVWGWRTWCRPFVWIGTNALTVYLAANILGPSGGFQAIAARVVGGPVKDLFGAAGPAVLALAGLAVMFLFARALHRRAIFLRL